MTRPASLARLLIAAGLVLVSDLASKQWALLHLVGHDYWLSGVLHLTIVHNHGLAWGMQAGGFGLQITSVLTLAVVALVAQVSEPLMAIDGAAPVALGMLVGAGAANLVDALVGPAGVVDFIAFTPRGGTTTVLNLADLLAAAGFVLLARTVWCLMRAMYDGGSWRPAAQAIHSPRTQSGLSSALPVGRSRAIVSLGYAFAAMCAFIWLYSIMIVWTPDAGQSAPSTMLCAAAVFAASFIAAESWSWFTVHRQLPRNQTSGGPREDAPQVRRPVLEVVVGRETVREPGAVPLAAARRRSPVHPPRPARLEHPEQTADQETGAE